MYALFHVRLYVNNAPLYIRPLVIGNDVYIVANGINVNPMVRKTWLTIESLNITETEL